METLARLEQRIDTLLARMRGLEDENKRLKREIDQALTEIEAENRRLREELERERSGKEAVLSRIDGLLAKLQDDPA
ncbi:MAG: cell division protein ZapB [Thermodesulfobacteriota bacterium]